MMNGFGDKKYPSKYGLTYHREKGYEKKRHKTKKEKKRKRKRQKQSGRYPNKRTSADNVEITPYKTSVADRTDTGRPTSPVPVHEELYEQPRQPSLALAHLSVGVCCTNNRFDKHRSIIKSHYRTLVPATRSLTNPI